jgi:hypothetical protein
LRTSSNNSHLYISLYISLTCHVATSLSLYFYRLYGFSINSYSTRYYNQIFLFLIPRHERKKKIYMHSEMYNSVYGGGWRAASPRGAALRFPVYYLCNALPPGGSSLLGAGGCAPAARLSPAPRDLEVACLPPGAFESLAEHFYSSPWLRSGGAGCRLWRSAACRVR